MLTGFGPFGGDDWNPAGAIASRLDGARLPGGRGPVVVRGRVIPVSSGRLPELLPALVEGCAAAVGLGVAVGRTRITLERTAFNERTFGVPDVDGAQPAGEPVERDGPPRLDASLPLEAIVRAWAGAGIPASPSDDPGRHLCNQWLYSVRRLRPELPAGFLHVPADERLGLDRDVPWVPIAQLELAVRVALAALAATLV